MHELPFHLDWIESLVTHRNALLTPVAQAFTFLGEMEGYVMLIGLVYVAFDKRLAVRLTVVTLVTMTCNHFLKTLIRNPRPFILDGSYRERWAVSATRAADLATEFSTPSGHAMAAAGFWGYLYACWHSRLGRISCALLILFIGLSRPYLGVHYFEDVGLGWLLGLAVALGAMQWGDDVARRWNAWSLRSQVLIAVGASGLLWLGTRLLEDPGAGRPAAFLSYTGFLTGVVVADRFESERVSFNPRSGSWWTKALRWMVFVALVMGTMTTLDVAFAAIASDGSVLGDGLRYIRYAATGAVGILGAPFVFVKCGLASPVIDDQEIRAQRAAIAAGPLGSP